jgi:glyoxylase-like metal-dependent hydrolase (beta-lactamase superfamily II)
MRRVKVGLVFVICIIPSVQPVFGQAVTQQSYERAKKILDESLKAYGGIETLRSIQNFSIHAEGDSLFRNQSRKVGGADRSPLRNDFTYDIKNDRYCLVLRMKFPGAVRVDQRQIFDGKELFQENLSRRNISKLPPPPPRRNRNSWLPQFSLLSALERANSLRFLSVASFNNRPHQVISFVNETGQQVSLYIDSETKLLSKWERMISDPIAGDTTTETIFPDYKIIGNQKVPTGRIVKIDNEITQEVRYVDVAVNSSLNDNAFKLDPEFKIAVPETPKSLTVTKVAANVYIVGIVTYDELKVLFIDFKDYIWVMEAPGVGADSRQVIDKIKETIPGKPIKYLAVTHHHSDHAGGVRTYIADGVTIVTTRGNSGYFERVAKSRFTIAPDDLMLKPQPLKIEFVENEKRVFTDGTQTVELYNFGPNPHAEEMLVAYLPKERILFEADVLDRPLNGDYPIAEESAVYLAAWITRNNLAVEKIIPVLGTITTMTELLTAVAEREKRTND